MATGSLGGQVCTPADGDNKLNFRSAEREGPPGRHLSGAGWKAARSEGVSSEEKSRLTINTGTTSKQMENNAVGVDRPPRGSALHEERGRPAESSGQGLQKGL